MLNYPEIVKQLEEKDEYAMTKLAIYHELSCASSAKNLSNEDMNEIVDCLQDIHFSNDESDYLYPQFAVAALYICNYDLNVLLTSVRENREELESQILDELDSM